MWLRFPVDCTSCFMIFVAFWDPIRLSWVRCLLDLKSSIPSPTIQLLLSRSSAWSICKHFRLQRDRYHTSRCSQGSAQHAVNVREWNKHLQKIRWKMVILLLFDWWWLVLCYASMGAICSFMSDTCLPCDWQSFPTLRGRDEGPAAGCWLEFWPETRTETAARSRGKVGWLK